MMRRLRMVNVDHLHVGWYQSAHFGNFLSPQLLESHFAYQTSIDESVCLVFGEKRKIGSCPEGAAPRRQLSLSLGVMVFL
jgi:hypothetical protein